jgi:hypothetical protein
MKKILISASQKISSQSFMTILRMEEGEKTERNKK